MIKLYLFLCFVIINILTGHCLRLKLVRIDRFEVCYTPAENPPYIIHHFNINPLKDSHYSLSASAEVFEEMHAKDLEGNIQIVRCQSRELLDSCEEFTTLRPPTNVCLFMRIKELGVRDVMEQFTPPIRCPIQKANYSATDLRYSMDKFTLFPLGNSYWKVRANGYLKKRLVGTICFEGQSFERNKNV